MKTTKKNHTIMGQRILMLLFKGTARVEPRLRYRDEMPGWSVYVARVDRIRYTGGATMQAGGAFNVGGLAYNVGG